MKKAIKHSNVESLQGQNGDLVQEREWFPSCSERCNRKFSGRKKPGP